MRIRFVCHGLDRTGYGENARSYVHALHEAGHDVSVALLGRPGVPDDFGPKGLLVHCLQEPRGRIRIPDVNIINSVPPAFRQNRIRGTLNLGLTTCEASHIPDHRVSDCGAVDGLLVMSRSDQQAYLSSGIPSHVVHAAADPSEFVCGADHHPPFEFLSIGVWTGRKNFKALLTAYAAEFKPDEPVRLTLKTSPHHSGADDADVIRRQVDRITETFRIPIPTIQIITDPMTRSGLLGLLRSASAYVSAHSGEGWGAPMFEAMAMGLPVIATGFSGNLDYMTRENSYLVDYRMTPVAIEEPSQAYDLTMRWAEVDILDLMRQMRHVYENLEEARQTGARARREILSRFTPASTAAEFLTAIAAREAA